MSWRFFSFTSGTWTNFLEEQVSHILSSLDVQGNQEKKNPDSHPLAGNIMIFTVILARLVQVPTSSTLTSALWCCFVSMIIWTVTVMALHHIRSNGNTAALEASLERSVLWLPSSQLAKTVSRVDSSWSWWSRDLLESSPYRLDLSTEENYQATDASLTCSGRFDEIRRDLDYNFHRVYSCERQQFQDDLIQSMLDSVARNTDDELDAEACPSSPESTTTTKRNWIVFTAGVMGAGKSHTMQQLHEKGRFPLDAFVTVDPDSVRRELPEFAYYVEHSPERAGELTRKESGMISEILTEAALRRHQNVLVDGTLRNATWYQDYFDRLRQHYPHRIGILHVTAPREAVLERALSRAKVTGRVVPRDLLERTMLEVPKSIQILAQKVDFCVELHNPPDSTDVEIKTPGVTWESFQAMWKQPSCAAAAATSSDVLCLPPGHGGVAG